MLRKTNTEKMAAPGERVMMRLLGLTRAQARVSALLVNDHTTAEIARRLGIQENTVRAHLKSTYAKTRTRNRGELIKLLIIAWHR